jgi:hypothetical protein
MKQQADPRLPDAQAIPIMKIAGRLGIRQLKRHGHEYVGPCPSCGGTDRFAINPRKGVFICRSGCSDAGADGIGLVRLVLGCDFKAALSWLVGEADVRLDPAEAARRDEDGDTTTAAAEARSERERKKSIAAARAIWGEGIAAAGTLVSAYLARRGLPPEIADAPPACLRFHPALRYAVHGGQGWQVVHTGPAMLGAIVAQNGAITAVHRTWLDLDQPKGKAVLTQGGEVLGAKKVLGSKKGCTIRLSHPRGDAFDTLVMGEGIETTLTALAADVYGPRCAYWAGIDLGNMAGRRLAGPGLRYSGLPDLEDREAFVPPPWITRLIYLMDGDSEPRMTRAQLEAGLRRARSRNAALRIQIAHAGAGRDLNDVLMGENDDADCAD